MYILWSTYRNVVFIYFGDVLTQTFLGQTSAHLLEIISCPAANFVLKMFYLLLFFHLYDIPFHKGILFD